MTVFEQLLMTCRKSHEHRGNPRTAFDIAVRSLPSLPKALLYYLATPIDSRKPSTGTTELGEGRRTLGAEDLLGGDLGETVGQGEGQVLGQELLDVRALDVVGLLELNNAEDLEDAVSSVRPTCGLGGNIRGSI